MTEIVNEIVKVTIIKTKGTDKIHLYTHLDSPFQHLGEEYLILYCEAPYDKGEEFVKNTFNINPKVISDR